MDEYFVSEANPSLYNVTGFPKKLGSSRLIVNASKQ